MWCVSKRCWPTNAQNRIKQDRDEVYRITNGQEGAHPTGAGRKPRNAVVGPDFPDPERAGREDSPHGLAGRRARDKRGRCHERLHAELRDRF